MKRREFITLLGGAAAWPLAARAQQGERMRRIGVLMPAPADDAELQARYRSVPAGAGAIGLDRRAQRPDRRALGAGDSDDVRRHAAELVALAPDVIVASAQPDGGGAAARSRTVPIVFLGVVDPVGAGFVASLHAQAATRPASLRSNTA